MKILLCFISLASALADDDLFKTVNDQFTAKMFQEVVRANEGKSCIMSAFSVLPPLAQLAQASTGPSHDELLTAIGLPDDDMTKKVFSKLNQQLNAVKRPKLNRASKFYIAQDAKLNKEFTAMSRDVFGSDYITNNIDFNNNVQSAESIKSWVEAQTNERIKNLVLLSSSGVWKSTFNIESTDDASFYVSKSKTVKVPTMNQIENYMYGESAELDAQLLELPYEDREVSFLVVLPNKIDADLTNLKKKLKNPSALNKAIGEMADQRVGLSMPKFKIVTDTDLKKVLEEMNVKKLWNPSEAKLDKLLENETKMSVSSAIQKTYIEVTEDGTEAPVANDFLLLGAPRPNMKLKWIHVERPFYFEIRINNTAIFNGAVVDF